MNALWSKLRFRDEHDQLQCGPNQTRQHGLELLLNMDMASIRRGLVNLEPWHEECAKCIWSA
jgi:hypothetical protein